MPELIRGPSLVDKTVGRTRFCDSFMFPVEPRKSHVSVSHMRCAGGWVEPEESPASVLDKYFLVLRGLLRIKYRGGVLDLRSEEGVIVRAGERVRASAPEPAGAEFIVVCLLGFTGMNDHHDRD